jgi:hypothetical protein
MLRYRRKKREAKAKCCFCAAYRPNADMKEKPAEVWDIGLPLVNTSRYCCKPCLSRSKSLAGNTRRMHGLFAAPDLDRWPVKPASEFVFKMLCVAERPPVDAQGFYPGGSTFANRPVTREDITSQDSRPIWRADWTAMNESVWGGRASAAAAASSGLATPTDWSALQLDELPSEAALGELWELANQRHIDSREMKRVRAAAKTKAATVSSESKGWGTGRDGDSTADDDPHAQQRRVKDRPCVTLDRGVRPKKDGGGKLMSGTFLGEFGFSSQATAEDSGFGSGNSVANGGDGGGGRELDAFPPFQGLGDGEEKGADDETDLFFAQMKSNKRPLQHDSLYMPPGAPAHQSRAASVGGRPTSAAGDGGTSGDLPTNRPSSRPGIRPGGRDAQEKLHSPPGGGRPEAGNQPVSRPSSTPYSIATPAMERKYARKFGIKRGHAPLLVPS